MAEQLARTRQLVATTAGWAAVDPFIVASGEIAVEIKIDGSRWIKIGDGATSFANLDYAFDFSNNPTFNNVIVGGTLTVDQLSADLTGSLYLRVKNTDTESLAKGTPFYISVTAAEAGVIEIKKAIASDVNKGPAVGLVAETISIGSEGKGVIAGEITDYNTSFPGWSSNQALYVGQSGGLTGTAPAGYKQIVARVGRVNTASGTLIVDRASGGDTSSLPNTDSIVEGSTNLYFTQTRSRNAISATGLIGYNPATGEISYTGATPVTSIPPTDLSYTASTRLLGSSTGADVTLPLFNPTTDGLTPSSGGGTTTFLRADGTWAVPPGSGAVSGVTSFSTGTTGLTPSATTTGEIILGGVLNVNSGGTGTTSSTGTGSTVRNTSPTLVTPILGTPTSGNLANCTGYTFANIASKPTTLSGYGITDGISASAANALTGANTFTNSTGQLFRQAAGQDGILLRGRAGGNSSYSVEILPTTLTASRILTAPNVSGTIITTGDTGSVTNTMLAGSIENAKLANSTISGIALGNNLATLTLGTGLSGTSYNGSGAVTATVTYGTTAGTACQGNDGRLSDTRNTTNAITFNNSGAGAASGTTFNGSVARTISYNSIGAAPTASPVFSGIITGSAYLDLGDTVSTTECVARVGIQRTGIGDAGVNFYTASGGAEAARVRKYGGTNSSLEFLNSGTGDVYFNLNNASLFTISAAGRLGFANGGGTSTGLNAVWGGSGTGAAGAAYHYTNPAIQADVTTGYATYVSATSLASAGSPVTMGNLKHFEANPGTKGANRTVTNEYGFIAEFSLTNGVNNYGFYGGIAAGANRWNFYAAGTAANYFTGTIGSIGVYNSTTASAANLAVNSSGDLQRSTSSIRYKTNVEDIEQEYTDNVILNARPVWYRSTCETDNQEWSWYGLIAEEVAELDPRLVFWGRPTKEVVLEEAKKEIVDEEGNVIQEASEATYTNVTDTDAPLRPEGVQYDRLTVMLIDFVQRQNEEIESLRNRITVLEETAAP